MDCLRTPNERFENLPGYPWSPQYTEIPNTEDGQLRVHHIDTHSDTGDKGEETLLCMHGQPTWSYLYRHMIPKFTDAGHRVLAPDLVGFGRSDKPSRREDYSYARHVTWMSSWLQKNNASNLTLVCQDWGGLIGLRLVAAMPERFSRVVVANTGMPDGMIPEELTQSLREAYETLPVVDITELTERFRATDGVPGLLYWIKFCAETPNLNVRELMMNNLPGLSDAELDAYAAPFPNDSYMMGARRFPSLIPLFVDDPEVPANRSAWERLRGFTKPLLTAFSDMDPVSAGGELRFQQEVPGAAGVEHKTVRGAGHFLQEDGGEALAHIILDFIAQTS